MAALVYVRESRRRHVFLEALAFHYHAFDAVDSCFVHSKGPPCGSPYTTQSLETKASGYIQGRGGTNFAAIPPCNHNLPLNHTHLGPLVIQIGRAHV